VKQVLSAIVYGAPVAQPRQRHRHVVTKAGGQFDMNYTPKTHPVQQFKADVKDAVMRANPPSALLDCPIVLECRFYLPRPHHLMRKRDLDGALPHTKKPDLDNLYKAVQDGLAKVIWYDDNQIVSFGPNHGKFYHEKAGRPRVELTVYALEVQ